MDKEKDQFVCKYEESKNSNSFLQNFVERWFLPTTILISGIFSVIAAVAAFYGKEASEKAALAAEQARQEAASARFNLDVEKFHQESNISMARLVIESLKSKDVEQQKLLIPLVETVQDPKVKEALSSILVQKTTDQAVKEQAQTVLTGAKSAIQNQESTKLGVVPSKFVQVFWCNFRNSRSNELLSEKMTKRLNGFKGKVIGGYKVSGYSSKPIDKQTERRLTPARTSSYIQVRYDFDDAAEKYFATSLSQNLSEAGTSVGLKASGSQSRSSVALLICE